MLKRIIINTAIPNSMAMPFQAVAEIDDLECYQGFIETGYTFGSGNFGQNSIDATTSHGYRHTYSPV